MPTYYFDVFDGHRSLYDKVGAELADLVEAEDEAVALLPEFAREILPDRQSHGFAAAVRDAGGSVVYRAVLLFQGNRTPEHDVARVTAVADARRQASRHAELKTEARALGERLTQNVEGLLTTLDELSANVAASRQARESRTTGRT